MSMVKKIKTGFVVVSVFAVVISAVLSAQAAAPEAKKAEAEKKIEMQESGWAKRCEDKENKKCEVFQVLSVKDSKARVAEFALGFPESKDVGRGGVILPLGILLEDGVTMRIDDGKPYVFKVRYCTNDGCVAFLKVDNALVAAMDKGKQITFSMKSAVGQNVNLVLSLSGFGKALKEIR